jgi:hypothetical protein
VTVIGVAGDAASDVEAAAANPAQQGLRVASASFASTAAAEGWVVEDDGGVARDALDMLLNGRSSDESAGTDEATASPAEAFIKAKGLDSIEPTQAAAALAAEVREARVRVRAVNAAAAQVVIGPERPSWARREDVRAAETVVKLARQARSLFRQVDDVIAADLSSDQQNAVRDELADFDVELSRLSAAADALSQPAPDVELRDVEVIASRDVG